MKFSKEKRRARHAFWQRVAGFVFLALLGLSFIGAAKSRIGRQIEDGGRVLLLLFGIDAADSSQHTDTLMVASFDPVQTSLSLLSIPRDTRIHLPGYLFNRVNEIYGYHYRRTKDAAMSASAVRSGVEYILSSTGTALSIPNYLELDYGGFIKIIDILGGVWVSVRQPMHYDDNAGNYHFHRDPGDYKLSGQEALFYVRFRGPTGDRGRILRQQEFVRAVTKRFMNPLAFFKIPALVGAVVESFQTNLSFWDVVYFTVAARHLRSSQINFYILPGKPRGAYWNYDKEFAPAFASHVLLGTPIEADFTPIIQPQAHRVTVDVWNASGKEGVAYEMTCFLRRRGYDVVDWGTYPTQQATSRVIDRRGKIMNAQTLASDLGIENIHSEPSPKALVDVDVVIGKSFQPPSDFSK